MSRAPVRTRSPREQRWAVSVALVVAAGWFVGSVAVLSRGWRW